MVSSSSPSELEIWVRDQYRQRCCDEDGRQLGSLSRLHRKLSYLRPNDEISIKEVTIKINQELYEMRPDCHPARIEEPVKTSRAIELKMVASRGSNQTRKAPATGTAEALLANPDLEAWVHYQFLDIGFEAKNGFIGYKKLQEKLHKLKPEYKANITSIIQKLRQPGHKFSFPSIDSVIATRKLQSIKIEATSSNSNCAAKTVSMKTPAMLDLEARPRQPHPIVLASSSSSKPSFCDNNPITNMKEKPILSTPSPGENPRAVPCGRQQEVVFQNQSNMVSSKTSILQGGIEDHSKANTFPRYPQALAKDKPSFRLNHQQNLLLAKTSGDEESNYDIRNAILVSAKIIEETDEKLLPQCGLLGSFHPDSCRSLKDSGDKRIFINTNIPFSAFICGVQGSGKSHTTACLVENCLISSPMLGFLEKPLSALVFHFSEFTSRTSYHPNEATFLSMAHCDFPEHPTVSHTTVIVPRSNYYNLKQLYTQIPKVEVRPFQLKPNVLDVGTMLVLMAVDQSKDRPLYMAQVTKILRDMATELNGGFDYLDFKRRLGRQKFDQKQKDFLDQRLDLLESFLDLKCSSSDLVFRPGEITIVDMSCPFVDANTACVLFKIAMKRYLESSAAGKIVVLDEAHKYMLDTPGATDLNEFLLTVIRQQRHFGARVIISTQEPTISTKLIDLCAITVIHRFTSPDWFRVLRTHISISSKGTDNEVDEKELFREILNLRTGEALVYAPTTVLGKDLTGKLVKATEELLKVSVRKRVTWDGGQAVVCV